jgi:hypothetical protein
VLKVQPVLTVLTVLTVLMELMANKVQRVLRVRLALREFKERPVVQIHRYLRYPQMQLSSLQIHLAQSKSFSNLQRIW